MKIALAQINPTIGDFKNNLIKIKNALREAREKGAELVLFSEMVLTGYPPQDLVLYPHFIKAAEEALLDLLPDTEDLYAIIGTVREDQKKLYNTAAVIGNGKVLGYQDKSLLPTYDVFAEERYFCPANEIKLFQLGKNKVAITICEDIWQHAKEVPHSHYLKDPVEEIAFLKPDLVLNLSASPYHFDKFEQRLQVAQKAAKTIKRPLILCNQVGGQDSLLFDGFSIVLDGQGHLKQVLKGFEEDLQVVDTNYLEAKSTVIFSSIENLYKALVMGIRDYFHKSGFKRACLGLSGGIDSALVACLGAEALGKENILGVAMPSRFSSESSLRDARSLAKNLGIELIEIPIEKPFKAYLEELEPLFENKPFDLTEENLQARIRGMLLMALSNKKGYLVLSTGNKSELALGYSTLYGDLAGGLAAISDVSKDKVYQLARYINREKEIIPLSTLEKPPSAELRPDQKDSDSLPPYPLIDKVLECYVEKQMSPDQISQKENIELSVVTHLIKMIHQSEYKRRQAPPGLRITAKAFSVGRNFPIVQKFI